MPNALLMEKHQLIFVKAEAIYNTDPGIVGANAVGAHSIKVTPIFEKVQSDDVNGIQGNQKSITVGQKVSVEFDVYLISANSVGTAPPCDPILLSSAMARVIAVNTKVTYTPVSNSFGSMTVIWEIGDYHQKVTGVRGEISIDMSVGGLRKLSFKGEGVYQDPVLATAITGVNATGLKDPVAVTKESTTCSYFNTSIQMKSAKIELGSRFGYVSLVNHEEVEFQGRDGSLSVDFRATDTLQRNFTLKAKNNATGSFTISNGIVGDRFILNIPSIEISDVPSLSFDNQVGYLSTSNKITPATNNSDFSLVFE